VYRLIDEVLTKDIRPQLLAHGGDIELVDVDSDGVVEVKLKGCCSSCPASQQTIENLVQTVLMQKVPGITGVRTAMQAASDELIREALRILRRDQVGKK
jgi:Fe-S cluster biogenesis protein NfuA